MRRSCALYGHITEVFIVNLTIYLITYERIAMTPKYCIALQCVDT